jgi:hypothetical protein
MSSYSEQVKKDAKAAADYIREHGWIQGRYFENMPNLDGTKGNGACCVHGAMMKATNVNTCGTPLRYAFAREIDRDIVAWNDTPGRTKEEVLAVFDKIANS